MQDKEKQTLYLALTAMERTLVDLERRVSASERFLKNRYPEIHSEYLKTLDSVKADDKSIAAQSLEQLRQMVFLDNV